MLGAMLETPLLHKPIHYGGAVADGAFWALVVLHVIVAALAVIGGVVAVAATKGGPLHLRAGAVFVRAMIGVALSGIALDVIRLGAYFEANHTKYAGMSMPSSIPARIAFLYAALAVLVLVRDGGRPARGITGPLDRALPAVVTLLGPALALVVVLFFNPWTGALWMIATFSAALAYVAWRRRIDRPDPAAAVRRHRFAMMTLVAFSWWGALQGFGPAIGIALVGDDPSVTPYVGDQPGPFTFVFFAFLIGWAPAFVVAALLARRWARARALRVRTA